MRINGVPLDKTEESEMEEHYISMLWSNRRTVLRVSTAPKLILESKRKTAYCLPFFWIGVGHIPTIGWRLLDVIYKCKIPDRRKIKMLVIGPIFLKITWDPSIPTQIPWESIATHSLYRQQKSSNSQTFSVNKFFFSVFSIKIIFHVSSFCSYSKRLCIVFTKYRGVAKSCTSWLMDVDGISVSIPG